MGYGFNNANALIAHMDSRRVSAELTGYSNGILQVLSFGGIINLIEYVVPTFLCFKNKRVFAFGLFCFIMFTMTIVGYTYLYLTILIFLYTVGITKSDTLLDF